MGPTHEVRVLRDFHRRLCPKSPNGSFSRVAFFSFFFSSQGKLRLESCFLSLFSDVDDVATIVACAWRTPRRHRDACESSLDRTPTPRLRPTLSPNARHTVYVRTLRDHSIVVRDAQVVTDVNTLIETYLRQERTIVLAVMPCNQDIATIDILERASAADPIGERQRTRHMLRFRILREVFESVS